MLIRVVTSLKEFGDLSDQWNKLLAETPSNNIFLTWEWLYTWARHYLGENRLHILLACEDDQIVGIAPLYIKTIESDRLLRLQQIEFLWKGEAC